jgi:REP element-mobilizing transposase RayT
MTDYEWDDNDWPLAYLITIRTFGTWLHGDERGSVDRHGQNVYGSPRITPNTKFSTLMRENESSEAFFFDGRQLAWVETAIRNVCDRRSYDLFALNVRTNHVHAVIAASIRPELIINGFKANVTRELRTNGLLPPNASVWSRGGSRRYLWKPHQVEAAIEYVLYGQGDDLPKA